MGLWETLRGVFGRKTERLNVYARFEILRAAVSGTMSQFYVVRDKRTGQIAGLKIADREKVAFFESRFKGLNKPSEGEIASQIRHPRVVETYEYGLTTENQPYLLMEYLEGPGLQQLVFNRDPVLQQLRVRLVRQMAEALKAVHDAGFIHRDICPRNFLFTTRDCTDIKLIDFGLTLPARKEFMQPGNRTGTPLYMAPEIIRRRHTDQRVDIFAFGVTAYHIITYELPWPATEISGLAALAHDTQPPRDIREYCPQLNETLAKAIMKCMEPAPKDRFQSIDQFLAAIASVPDEQVSGAGVEPHRTSG
ncbi:MAG: serine/threonine protein kinase [Pirellulaceae bacterium]|nr:MAG: serine/threonine protein kinase [Pirellulaceae bacterium]